MGLDVPAILPSSSTVNSVPPSLHRVPWGEFPCFTGNMRYSDSLSPIPPRSVAFAQQYHLVETRGPPRFLGDPNACMPCSQTPAGSPRQPVGVWQARTRTTNVSSHATTADHARFTARQQPYNVSILPSVHPHDVGSHNSLISGLNYTACTLAVYASQHGLPQCHARLASGWWPTFTGRDLLPAGSPYKVSAMPPHCFPLVQAFLAHVDLSMQCCSKIEEKSQRLSILLKI